MTTTEIDPACRAMISTRPAENRGQRIPSETVSPKIQPYHLERLAVVYVRQSSPHQVLEHRESTARQYALADRAVELGWPRDRVLVIDEDQGQSGRTAEGRAGFQKLLVELNLDHVGLILGLEMSRLARSNKDWHHLLEVCAIFRTLLADSDGLYDPNDPNDRMLLGLKGTISEVELHTLRNRLNQGRLNKARRAELFTVAPIGYVRLADDTLAFDPDEQVQSFIRLVFAKFQELGSASALVRYLTRHDIQIGVRSQNGRVLGPVEWHPATYTTLRGILHNPTYAGAYCMGRRTSDIRRRGPSRSHPIFLPMEEWKVLVPDAVPAYITWDQFLANRATLASNHARLAQMGAARNGPALLPGLLICGFCGARMVVQYKKHNGVRYACAHRAMKLGVDRCQDVLGRRLEQLVQDKVLRALEPAALELSLQAASETEQELARLHKHWQQRLDRARYETGRAARQYHAVEPENRLVARELEKSWDSALGAQRKLEEDYARFQRDRPHTLSLEEAERIRALATDIPAIWHSPATTPQDRKMIVRQLIDRIVVKAQSAPEYVDVTIHWAGGFVSEHEVRQTVGSWPRLRDYERLRQRIVELRNEGCTYPQICQRLVEEDFHSPTGKDAFRPENIRVFLMRYCREGEQPGDWTINKYVQPNEWLIADIAREIGMPQGTVHYWRRRGWIHARQVGDRWVFWADDEEMNRLRQLRVAPTRTGPEPHPPALTTPKALPNAE